MKGWFDRVLPQTVAYAQRLRTLDSTARLRFQKLADFGLSWHLKIEVEPLPPEHRQCGSDAGEIIRC